MNFRKSVFLSLAVVAFAAPGLSSATSQGYPAQGDSVGPFPQEHFQSTKTRAQVMQELEVARQDGTLPTNLNRDYPFTKNSLGSGKTRAEVQNELLTLSAEEKKRMRELYRGGR
jgi:hypothetical protein